MGGHDALTSALKYPGRDRSVSAFALIVSPSLPWNARTTRFALARTACASRDPPHLPKRLKTKRYRTVYFSVDTISIMD